MANRTDKPWSAEVSELLARAAALCVEHDIELDAFVRGAFSTYLVASPGAAKELADRQLSQQIEDLRRSGRIAQA